MELHNLLQGLTVPDLELLYQECRQDCEQRVREACDYIKATSFWMVGDEPFDERNCDPDGSLAEYYDALCMIADELNRREQLKHTA
jgi:hypothetical protein